MLSVRQDLILSAIANYYSEYGKPISSSKLKDLLDLEISASTLRNEMATLKDLGYLDKPYYSSGKIPSDLGYHKLISDKEDVFYNMNLSNKSKDSLLESLKDVSSNKDVLFYYISLSNLGSIKLFKFVNLINTSLCIIKTSTGDLVTEEYPFKLSHPDKISDLINDSVSGKDLIEAYETIKDDSSKLLVEECNISFDLTTIFHKVITNALYKNIEVFGQCGKIKSEDNLDLCLYFKDKSNQIKRTEINKASFLMDLRNTFALLDDQCLLGLVSSKYIDVCDLAEEIED